MKIDISRINLRFDFPKNDHICHCFEPFLTLCFKVEQRKFWLGIIFSHFDGETRCNLRLKTDGASIESSDLDGKELKLTKLLLDAYGNKHEYSRTKRRQILKE